MAQALHVAELLGEGVTLFEVREGAIEVHLVVEIPAQLEVDPGEPLQIAELLGDDLYLREHSSALLVTVQASTPPRPRQAGGRYEASDDAFVVARGLLSGEARHGLLRRPPEILQRLLDVAALLIVMGEQIELLVPEIGDGGLQGFRDLLVIGPPFLLGEALVGHLPCEGVLEGVLEVGEEIRVVEELRGLEPGEAATDRLLPVLGHGL